MTDKKKTIFRRAKDRENPYVMIDRTFFENTELSWKAKGLMGYLLSRPNDWTVIQADLVNRSTDGVHATRAGIAELLKAGYLTRHTIRNPDGTIKEHEIQVHEIPVPSEQRTIPRKNKSRPPASQPTLPMQPESGFQHVVNQHVDKPHVENSTLLSTDLLSTDLTKKEEPTFSEPPEPETREKQEPERTYLGDCAKTFERTGGRGSPTVPEDAPEGLDLFEFEPLIAFCETIGMNHADLTEKNRLSWRRELRTLAQETGTQPAEMAAAIRASKLSEFDWMTFTWPGQKSFQNTVMILISRIKNRAPLNQGRQAGHTTPAPATAKTPPSLPGQVQRRKEARIKVMLEEGKVKEARRYAELYGLTMPAAVAAD